MRWRGIRARCRSREHNAVRVSHGPMIASPRPDTARRARSRLRTACRAGCQNKMQTAQARPARIPARGHRHPIAGGGGGADAQPRWASRGGDCLGTRPPQGRAATSEPRCLPEPRRRVRAPSSSRSCTRNPSTPSASNVTPSIPGAPSFLWGRQPALQRRDWSFRIRSTRNMRSSPRSSQNAPIPRKGI